VVLVFTPSTAGDKAATLTVQGAAGETVTVNLSGAGITPAGLTLTAGTPADAVLGQTSSRTYTVTNGANMVAMPTGMLTIALSGADAGSYSVSMNTCTSLTALGETCTFVVNFAPTTAGTKNAVVTVHGMLNGTGSQTLSSTGLTAVTITPHVPGQADFGQVTVGQPGPAHAFDIVVRAPQTSAAASVSGEWVISTPLAGCGALGAIDPATPGSYVTCTVSAQFVPVAPVGAKMGTLTFTGSAGTGTLALTGTAVGPLTASPATVAFGSHLVGGFAPVTVTVSNSNTTAPITGITAALSGANAGELVLTANNCNSASLTNPATCTITVTPMFTTVGTKTATLTVNGTFQGGAVTTTVPITATVTSPTPPAAAISLSPTAPSITNVPITGSGSVVVTLTNPAGAAQPTGAITIPSPLPDAKFTITSNNCVGGMASLNPGQSCTFSVTFTPTAAFGVGTATTLLTVNTHDMGSATATVSGTSIQSLSVAPTTLTFTPAAPSTVSTIQTIMVTNAGTAITTPAVNTWIADGGANPHGAYFAIMGNTCGTTIPAMGSCTVGVVFSPGAVAPGAATGVLTIQDAATGHIVATTALNGTVVNDAVLAWSPQDPPANIDFGTVPVGTATATSSPYTLTNTGGVATGAITFGGVAAPFAAVGVANGAIPACATNGTQTLAPNASCSVGFTFTPSAVGAATQATVAVTAVHAANVSVAVTAPGTFTLDGTGAPTSGAGSVYVTPTPANLGAVAATGTGTAATFTVHNTSGATIFLGATPVAINAVSFPGGTVGTPFTVTQGSCANAAVATAGTCTFTVTFDPTAATTAPVGQYTALATVTYGGGTASASVFGRVTTNAVLDVTAPTGGGAFGQVIVNTASANREWTVKNDGEQPATGLSFVLGGANAAEFSTADSTCTATLAVGASCIVRVKVTPAATAARAATLTIDATNNDNPPGPFATNLTATGVTTAMLSATPSPAAFGTVHIGDPTVVTVTVRNTAVATAQTTGPLTFTLSNTAEYTVTDSAVNGCATARVSGLATNTTCDVDVTLTAASAKTLNDTLTISATPGGMVAVPLTGTSVSAVTTTNPAAFANGQTRTVTFTLLSATNPTASGNLTVALGGANAGSFSIASDTCTGVSLTHLAATCTVGVTYTGTGAATATLTATGTTPGDTATATLTGM